MDVSLTDGSGNGLSFGSYFLNPDFTGSVVNKFDTTVDFDWGLGAPTADLTIGVDNFSVRWVGDVQPSFSEVYTLLSTSWRTTGVACGCVGSLCWTTFLVSLLV